MIYLLFLLLGIMLVPAILLILAIFKPFSLKLRFSEGISYSIDMGYEIEGVFAQVYFITIVKEYHTVFGDIVHAELLYKFWKNPEYWKEKNRVELEWESLGD